MRSEQVVRRADLHLGLQPIPILAGDPPEPINASSATIVQRRDDDRGESFALELYDAAGALLESLQFETLEIALDQAAEIIGVQRADWRGADG